MDIDSCPICGVFWGCVFGCGFYGALFLTWALAS